jgi:hypothetical protein
MASTRSKLTSSNVLSAKIYLHDEKVLRDKKIFQPMTPDQFP